MKEQDLIERYQVVKAYKEGVTSPFFALLEAYAEELGQETFRSLTESAKPQGDELDYIAMVRGMKKLLAHARSEAKTMAALRQKLDTAGIAHSEPEEADV